MKKRYILSAVGAIGAGYLLTNKEKREKLKDNVKFYAKKFQNNNTDDFFNTTLEDAGRPDQTTNRDLAQFEKDRKSTRLNSSHVAISYAVVCLQKKKRKD